MDHYAIMAFTGSAKKPKRSFTVDFKLFAINKWRELNKNKAETARVLGIHRPNLIKWIKNEPELREQLRRRDNKKRLKSRTHRMKYPELEEKVVKWFKEEREMKHCVTHKRVAEYARDVAEELNLRPFKGSNGWLWRFLKRNNLVMPDYWKSQPRKFCEFCNYWLTDNKPSIEFHEKGKRHQKNVRKKIEKDKTEESDVIVKLEPEEIKKEDDSEVDAVFEGPLPRNADTDNQTRAETCTSRKAYGEWVTYEEEAPVDYELPEVPTKDIPVPDFSKKESLIVKFKFKDKHVTSRSSSDDVTAVAFKKCKVTKGAGNMCSRDVSDD